MSQQPGNCFIHDQKRTTSSLEFLGWAVGNPSEAPEAITVAVTKNGNATNFTTKFYNRPDIAKAYKNSALLRTGFIAYIPSAEVPAGSELSVIIEGSKENFRCKNTFKAI